MATAALLIGLFPATVSAVGPIVVNDHVSVPVDAPATTLAVLANDIGSGLAIDSAGPAGHGIIEVAVDGLTLTYQPDASFHSTDTFNYTITDGDSTDTGAVTVDVNSPPVAVADPGNDCQPTAEWGGSFPVPEDFVGTVAPTDQFVLFGPCGVLHNDTDADNDVLSYEILTQPAHGEATKIDDDFFSYRPDPNYSTKPGDEPGGQWLSDSFTYWAFDGIAHSAPATMKFWVAPINDVPTFTPGGTVNVNEDSPAYSASWAMNVSPGPANEADQSVSFLPDGPAPVTGTPNLFSILPALDHNGILTFTPAPDANGVAHVTFVLKDDGGTLPDYTQGTPTPGADDTTDAFTFDINVVADAVSAVDDHLGMSEDPDPSPVLLDVLGNDSYPPTATITAFTPGTLGDVSIAPGGLGLLYAPHANANGSDIFTYTLNDHAGSMDTAAVEVVISAVNDVPVAVNDDLNVSRNAPATAVPVLTNDSDADAGDTLAITGASDPPKGTIVITPGGSGLTYQPDTDATGLDSFTYTVSDGHSPGVTANVSVTIAEGVLPVAVDDAKTLLEDAAATVIPVLDNDTDGDGDILTMTGKTNGAKGAVSLIDPTTLKYKPNANANGADTFTYTINDGHGGSATGTVNVTITPVNDIPNAVNDASFTVPESAGPRSLPVLANDTDIDGGTTLNITKVTQGAHGSVAITGGGTGLTYDPVQLYYGSDLFTYTVSDGLLTDNATVLLTVVKDAIKPVVTAPIEVFYGQTVGSSTVNARIFWSGSDPNGTGIARYQLQVSTNGGAYATVTLPSATSTSINRTLTDGRSYRFRVRATDKQGNVGAFAYGPSFRPARAQNTSTSVHYTGTWALTSSSSALGGSQRYATSTGARASFTTTTRDIAWVATRSSTAGSAQVWIDGVLATTVNLHTASTSYRRLVFARHFNTLGSHTIELRPIGGGRVYLDAFLVYH